MGRSTSDEPSALPADSRKAAGTWGMSDAIRHPLKLMRALSGGPFGDPAADLRDVRAGTPLLVSAHRVDSGGRRMGVLTLQLFASSRITWRRYRPFRGYASPEALALPLKVIGVFYELPGPPVTPFRGGPGAGHRYIVVSADGQRCAYLIPIHDVPLVRGAIEFIARK
jgi:hypothetical protein